MCEMYQGWFLDKMGKHPSLKCQDFTQKKKIKYVEICFFVKRYVMTKLAFPSEANYKNLILIGWALHGRQEKTPSPVVAVMYYSARVIESSISPANIIRCQSLKFQSTIRIIFPKINSTGKNKCRDMQIFKQLPIDALSCPLSFSIRIIGIILFPMLFGNLINDKLDWIENWSKYGAMSSWIILEV